MKKSFLLFIFITIFSYANFMDKIGNIVESTLSNNEDESVVINQNIGTLISDDISKKKVDSLIDNIKSTINRKNKKSIFNRRIIEMVDIIKFEKGNIFGLPSVFGVNKKKQKKVFGSIILGDIKDTGNSLYKGFKYSGKSAEFISGLIYRSSKIYNGMFNVLDDSAFNIFEDNEPSIFNVLEDSDEILNIFD